jgi:2-hydroxymuconate-semialdehyde hydrolase
MAIVTANGRTVHYRSPDATKGHVVLLVHGAEDRVTPLRSAALPLLEHLADVQLHVLGRCGHVPAVERPEDFRRLLSEFLRRA